MAPTISGLKVFLRGPYTINLLLFLTLANAAGVT
jgi:hypothetical protein